LDVLVYVPAGLWESAIGDFDALAERGRHRVEEQLHTARLIGQFALETARRRVEEALGGLPPRVGGDPDAGKIAVDGRRPVGPRTDTTETGGERGTRDGARQAARKRAVAGPLPAVSGGDPVMELAIPGYDSLSASQVVGRLGGLSREELVDVKSHELTHRHRRTILNRVEQLLGGDAAARP
jgi:hypothetical protein